MTDSEISEKALEYVRRNYRELFKNFCNLKDYPADIYPFTFFMAGSPGAGKTEFSIALRKALYNKKSDSKIVRIDADEIRNLLPGYNGSNAHLFQSASIRGLEKLVDHVLHNNQSAIIDGTFAHYNPSRKNVIRSLDKNRQIEIWYIYQDPKIAWDFTRKREKIEGRRIQKNNFIESFFSAKENVNKIKDEFGKKINVNLVVKDISNGTENTYFNIPKIDNFISMKYNANILEEILL